MSLGLRLIAGRAGGRSRSVRARARSWRTSRQMWSPQKGFHIGILPPSIQMSRPAANAAGFRGVGTFL